MREIIFYNVEVLAVVIGVYQHVINLRTEVIYPFVKKRAVYFHARENGRTDVLTDFHRSFFVSFSNLHFCLCRLVGRVDCLRSSKRIDICRMEPQADLIPK